MEDLYAQIIGRLGALFVLTILDVILGVIVALRDGKFEWNKLAKFAQTDGIPIIVWLVAEIMNMIPIEYIPAGYEKVIPIIPAAIYIAVSLQILGSIFKNISNLGFLTSILDRVGVKPDEEHDPRRIEPGG